MITKVTIACISWIDPAPLPNVGFWEFAGATTSWANRVIMGLVATANPRPAVSIPSIRDFMRGKQYRAALSCVVELGQAVWVSERILDPGHTPPFDKNKIDTSLRVLAPSSPDFHAGEASSLSSIDALRLHPSSTLQLKGGDKVIVSGLLKFRAGAATDRLGTEKAGSPVHVPWVWSEFALVLNGSEYRLICRGSKFPSHAWYINGKQVAINIQSQVTISETDPVLTTGRSAKLIQSDASTDKGTGSVDKHDDAVGAIRQIEVALKL